MVGNVAKMPDSSAFNCWWFAGMWSDAQHWESGNAGINEWMNHYNESLDNTDDKICSSLQLCGHKHHALFHAIQSKTGAGGAGWWGPWRVDGGGGGGGGWAGHRDALSWKINEQGCFSRLCCSLIQEGPWRVVIRAALGGTKEARVATESGGNYNYRETKDGALASSQILAGFQEQPNAGSSWALVQARNILIKGIQGRSWHEPTCSSG